MRTASSISGRGVAAGDARGRIGAGRCEEDQEHQHADAEHHEQHLAEPPEEGEQHQLASQPDLGARIERIAQTVAEHIEREHGQHDGDAGGQRHPWAAYRAAPGRPG